MRKITPHLWYADRADEAAEFYTSIFPNSRVDRVSPLPVDSPSGPAGTVKLVEFTLFGEPFMAISAGPLDQFNHSVSFMVRCDDQDEIDTYWERLQEGGGSPEPCGWLRDKFGVSWQVAPVALDEMLRGDRDPEAAKRAGEAMLRMQKLDVAELQAAYDGVPAH